MLSCDVRRLGCGLSGRLLVGRVVAGGRAISEWYEENHRFRPDDTAGGWRILVTLRKPLDAHRTSWLCTCENRVLSYIEDRRSATRLAPSNLVKPC